MRSPSAGRISVILIWIAIWTVVLAVDANLDHLSDSPMLLAALFVVPQLVLGYVVGPWAILAVVPLAAAWAPLAHSDCVASGAECASPVPLAIELAIVWGGAVALGYGVRVALLMRRPRP
jgi:hypothetical protein